MIEFLSCGYGSLSAEEYLKCLWENRVSVMVDTIHSISRPELHDAATYMQYDIRLVHDLRLRGHRSRKDAPNIPMDTNAGWRVRNWRYYANYAMTDNFQAGLKSLARTRHRVGTRVGFMCCESTPWRCHRNIITDCLASLVGSAKVGHLIGDKIVEYSAGRYGPMPRRTAQPGLICYPA